MLLMNRFLKPSHFLFRSFSKGEAKVAMMTDKGEEDPANTTTATIMNAVPAPIINLGENSDVYVGSVPDGKKVPSVIKSQTFQGCMEDLVFGGEMMGVWNWKVKNFT